MDNHIPYTRQNLDNSYITNSQNCFALKERSLCKYFYYT